MAPVWSQSEGFQFIPNQGQWSEPFAFKARLGNGEIFFSKNRMTFSFWDASQHAKAMEALHHRDKSASETVDAHAVYADFVGANPQAALTGSNPYGFYHNYYQGKDQTKWKSEVPVYGRMMYQQLYPGIDMVFYTDSSHLKYDWIVAPKGKSADIQIRYSGVQSMALMEDGGLHILTSVNEWIEQKPYAYQIIDGQRKEVNCKFVIKDDVVSFKLGKYDRSKELVIDPTLIFATYSGSTKDNWGFTATYDFNDNMYGGGIVFSNNAFPSNPGSFQLNYGGGSYDVLLCKFNDVGTSMMYYTYFGGGSADAPMSLVCNANNELFILGVTGSSNLPITAGVFQTGFAGGPSTSVISVGITNDFGGGSDLFIAKFNPTGTSLMACTFVGGSGLDGLNVANAGLQHNYADEFRGEIIVDNAGNCYIASSTK